MVVGRIRTGVMVCQKGLHVAVKLMGVLSILSVLSGEAPGAELTVSQRSFGPNADITVSFSDAPGNANDWVGLYQAGAADRNYISFQYLSGSRDGTLLFTSSETAGDYNLRMFLDNGYFLLATSPTITVSSPADIDPTFGDNGWVKFDFLGTATSDWICAVSVLEDGRILAAGTARTGLTSPNGWEQNEIALARFTPDGELDDTFGESGTVRTDITDRYSFPLNYAGASAMAVQADGKIIVGGSTERDFLLVRFTADGGVDASFGTNGIVLTDMRYSEEDPVSYDEIHCLVLQADGRILAGGASLLDQPYSPGKLALARYNPDGSPDASFNGLGRLWVSYRNITGHFRWAVNSIAVDSDGSLLAGITGIAQSGMNCLAIARYGQDAALDSSFGTNGILIENRPGIHNEQYLTSAALMPEGKITVLGHDTHLWFVNRYEADGTIDGSFGTAGQTTSDLSQYGDIPCGMIFLPGGKLLVGLSFESYYGPSVSGTFGLARYDANGRLDQDFGRVRFPLTVDSRKLGNQALTMALQYPDAVILAGFTDNGSQMLDFTLARVLLKPLASGERGDANGDQAINVLDMLAIANHILGIAPLGGQQMDAADCNGDGNVNVLDMIGIANVILGNGGCQP